MKIIQVIYLLFKDFFFDLNAKYFKRNLKKIKTNFG